jgi:DHA1 family bicyclomycin/chloramphenicol resistance-like MFS transporter
MGPLGMHIVLPSMPGLQAAFATDYATVQLTLTLYFAAFATAQLVYGPLSDRFGRRPVILVGLGLFLAGNLACMLAPSIEALIAGRVLQAIGACAGMSLGRAIVRDVYSRERAASMMAYVTTAIVVAPMIGPTLGGIIDVTLGWRYVFGFVLLLGAAIFLASVLALEETHTQRGTVTSVRGMLGSYGVLLARREFLGYALPTACIVSAFFGFIGSAPYVVVTLMGRPPHEYGFYFIFIAGAFMLGNLVAGRITPRVGSDRMIFIGCVLTIVGAAIQAAIVLGGWLTPISFFAPMVLINFGNGFAMPNGNIGAVSVDPARAGAAAGLTGFMQMGLGAVVSHLVGMAMSDSALPVVVAYLTLSTAGLLVHVWGTRPAR